MLILNTFSGENRPLVIDGYGESISDVSFTFQGTQAYKSCSLTWKGQMLVFGGDENKTQIAKINKCKLEQIGSLVFNHYYGACTVGGDGDIYLCFNADDSNDYEKCRKSSDPTGLFSEIPLTKYEHRYTRVASSNSMYRKIISFLYFCYFQTKFSRSGV